MPAIYDNIGDTYSRTRCADERIVEQIVNLLDISEGARVLDIGAGTGSYALALAERGFEVTALEPSAVMTSQASEHPTVTWVTGSAEKLPFESGHFDASILILCIHHFTNLELALSEASRVTGCGPILIFTYDPSKVDDPWLFEYFPLFQTQIRNSFPSTDLLSFHLSSRGRMSIQEFPLPYDLRDSFAGAAWRYPEHYLDQAFRDGTSAFRQLAPEICRDGLKHLREDLLSGRWDKKHGQIRTLSEYDHGYTFILSDGE